MKYTFNQLFNKVCEIRLKRFQLNNFLNESNLHIWPRKRKVHFSYSILESLTMVLNELYSQVKGSISQRFNNCLILFDIGLFYKNKTHGSI